MYFLCIQNCVVTDTESGYKDSTKVRRKSVAHEPEKTEKKKKKKEIIRDKGISKRDRREEES